MDWLACDYPERPYGPGIHWHIASGHCRACAVRYQVDRLQMKPEHQAVMDAVFDGAAGVVDPCMVGHR